MLMHPDSHRPAGGPILIVDDEPYILRSLSYLLTREGFAVETATDGEEGLKRARELRPPLIFLDIMLPRKDGYEVCEEIRRDPALMEAYVILLSAKGQQSDRERGLRGGANEYMTKPFSPREVAQRVSAVLGGHNPRSQRSALAAGHLAERPMSLSRLRAAGAGTPSEDGVPS